MVKKALLVGQTPPPFHGQAVVTQILFEHEWQDDGLEVELLRMSYSKDIDDVGSAGLAKIMHLFELVFKTWWIVITKRPQVLYYPPAGGNTVPIIRDIIYLGLTRFLFKKTIFHFHAGGLTDYLKSDTMIARLANKVYRMPDVSIELYDELDSPGKLLKAKNIEIVPNGLKISIIAHELNRDKKLNILFVGSLSESKGVLQLIETAKLLKKQNFNLKIKVAGEWVSEDLKSQALTLIRKYELESMITFIGLVQGEVKWKVYSEADIFFFPSHYEAEKFPLVLIEAMGCSCAVISTNWRGIPQLVGDSNAAILCDIKSPEHYAAAITKLYNNTGILEQMQQAARAHYLAKYTKEKFLNDMAMIFNQLKL